MIYELRNEFISIKVDSFGAEMHSLQRNNLEYIWQCGDAWKRYAPILFPFIGSPKEHKYMVDDKEYIMNANHGFARDMEFEMVKCTSDEVTFVLYSNEVTLKQYPFYFALEIKYHLIENGVEVIHNLKNKGDKPMYFYLGGHPAFNCPIDSESTFNDYEVVYEKTENLKYQNESKVENVINGKRMALSRALFDNDAIILGEPNSKSVSLCSDKSIHSVTVEFPNSNAIAVWSPTGDNNAAFVCLEPWTSLPIDYDNDEEELSKKRHATRLEKGKEFNYYYKILVN